MPKKALLKRSEKTFLLFVCFGMVLIGASTLLKGSGIENRYFEFAAGIGGGAIGLGSFGLIYLRRHPVNAKQQEIHEKDERNIKIRETSAYNSFYLTLLCLVAAIFVFLILNNLVATGIVTVLVAVHVASFFILMSINSKKL